jgi:replicative DNA helicase
MSVELAAAQALWSLGNSHPETARRVLDETGARADDLADAELRTIFATIEERIRRLTPLDLVTLAQSLSEKVDPAKVLALDEFVPPGVERERLEQLRDVASRRRCIDAMRAVAVRIKEGSPLAAIEADLRALPQLVAGAKPRVRSARGDTMRIIDAAESAWKSGKPTSLPTGWEDLDAVLRLTPNLHAIGAHPGVGKSAFVAGLVHGWTHRGVMTGVLTWEDDAIDMQQRILACEAELELKAIQGDHRISEAEMGRWADATPIRGDAEKFLWVDDAHPRGTITDACASLRAMRAKGCAVGILDNVSCVRMDADRERHLELEGALLALRDTALELRMPVIVIGHLKRGQTSSDEVTTEPKLSDFAGAASWERFARSCCGMWRIEDGVPGLVVLKQNAGAVGDRFRVHLRASAATVTGVELMARPPKTGRQEYQR